MLCCWKKIQWKKIIIAGCIYVIVSFLIRQIEVVMTMRYYIMPEYFDVWSKIMMPKPGPPPFIFMQLSLLFSFITGVTLAVFYDFIKGLFPKNYWKQVLYFTKVILVLMLVFSYLPMYLLINIPIALLISWFLTGGITVFFAAMIFAKVIK